MGNKRRLLKEEMDEQEAFERMVDEIVDEPLLEPEIPPPIVHGSGLTATQQDHFRAIMVELAERERESLALYEPMPEQERFHSSVAPIRIVIGGNRGGKTLATMVELARAVTNQDPHGKYSTNGGKAIFVGKSLRHIGEVIYPLLFKEGAFKIILDPFTGRWRSFRPHADWDRANAHMSRPAPPLIPERFLGSKAFVWENKGASIPKLARLKTNWRLLFYSGEAAPPQGFTADTINFDEEIIHPQWYTESQARIIGSRVELGDRRFLNGRFTWGATPQSGTEHLYDLSEKADNLVGTDLPSVEKFNVSLLENIHMSQESKDQLIDALGDNEDEYNVRVLGKFAIQGTRVYPEVAPKGAHGVPYFPIPDNWTRYVSIDPGHQICAVLFLAVPPPSLSHIVVGAREIPVKGRKIIYDELYIKKCTAAKFAKALKKKAGIQGIYSAFIDHHCGRTTEIGSGLLVEEQYSAALRKVRFKFDATGYGFIWGSDNPDAGVEAVRDGLHLNEHGIPMWGIMHEKVPSFIEEIKRYSYKKIPGTNITTDVILKKHDHAMDAWRYLAMGKTKYVKPKPISARKAGGNAELLAAKKERAKHRLAKDGGDAIKVW